MPYFNKNSIPVQPPAPKRIVRANYEHFKSGYERAVQNSVYEEIATSIVTHNPELADKRSGCPCDEMFVKLFVSGNLGG